MQALIRRSPSRKATTKFLIGECSTDKKWQMIRAHTLWYIWKNRNEKMFSHKPRDLLFTCNNGVLKLLQLCKTSLCDASNCNFDQHHIMRVNRSSRWKASLVKMYSPARLSLIQFLEALST
ncbi:hypothetical protein KP509_07G012400 [Ceratopteris richardii]|uniref:Uncharacterized protein n=1 Tax=Ceratopteris richardii TaxID=49495 RepID=A0A8T2UC02_CERRI|nr:hypothetical protein KP509_07G012400 [Ceratopteris richardii]